MSGPVPLVDSVAAAVAAKVKPATVRSWAWRGYLTAQGRDARGRSLYALADVYAVAASKDRTRGANLR